MHSTDVLHLIYVVVVAVICACGSSLPALVPHAPGRVEGEATTRKDEMKSNSGGGGGGVVVWWLWWWWWWWCGSSNGMKTIIVIIRVNLIVYANVK